MKALGIILIVIGLPMLIVPIIGVPMIIIGIIVIMSSIGSSNAEKTAQAIAAVQMQQPPTNTAEDDKWQALINYDDDIKAAYQELAPLGETATNKLKTIYLSLNDKSKLVQIVADIKKQFS